MTKQSLMKVGLAQISPILLDKKRTIEKIIDFISSAGNDGCDLIVFGEALLPGYPFWLGLTGGAEFNSNIQKQIFAHYVRNSIDLESGELDPICRIARQMNIAIYLGIIERPQDRSGHSLYCSLIYIDKEGVIRSVHRKLQPTYEERLVWSQGDGNGLRTHKMGRFCLGGLNCWENWMPQARTALYGMGENVHIAVWPGSRHNTEDITQFIAKESRSFVISVSSLMTTNDFSDDIPHLTDILENSPDILTDGGSCIAGPDGKWIIEPRINEEAIFTAELDIDKVYKERQNFDPAGHYSRPDVLKLSVNRSRNSIIEVNDN